MSCSSRKPCPLAVQPLKLIELPIPRATTCSVVLQVLATLLQPYTDGIHNGKLQDTYHFHQPLVPNANAICRVHEIGPDAVRLKKGDLVFVDATIYGKDNPDFMILQGLLGGETPEARILMQGE
jgi:NADPH:quinone reductase-like Zn-dependent oxidoreductase